MLLQASARRAARRAGNAAVCGITAMPRPEIAASDIPESDDVRILRALRIDPRVGSATAAKVLGISGPTVARRYRRMRRAGAIRVVGVVDPGALGQSRWMVRPRRRRARPPGVEAMEVSPVVHRRIEQAGARVDGEHLM
ncbi:AsnC family transcriptional regulator [Streptomyces sp. WP-1]|uniref:AsnC family transcriptional regulator n=1 Tax=Streptomyces sp. WP-1 TaxID=3041497 RepID=UPI002648369A|nr:AsnC family transcriptional regulator [Streptomyces sp. WP-1]WKE68913.1 AsnC family transcriptional regulator [Streptomyces sp. WP-1]